MVQPSGKLHYYVISFVTFELQLFSNISKYDTTDGSTRFKKTNATTLMLKKIFVSFIYLFIYF